MNWLVAKLPRRGPRLTIKAGFTLGVLVAVLQLAASGPQAATPSERSPLPRLLPGQSTTVVAPAATVLSTQHYQTMIGLTCSSSTCSGDFPKPGAKRRTNVTRISCYVLAGNGSAYTSGFATLLGAQDQVLVNQYLPVDFSSTIGDHQLNRAVDFQVTTSQHLRVVLHAGASFAGFCTATGTLETLQ